MEIRKSRHISFIGGHVTARVGVPIREIGEEKTARRSLILSSCASAAPACTADVTARNRIIDERCHAVVDDILLGCIIARRLDPSIDCCPGSIGIR